MEKKNKIVEEEINFEKILEALEMNQGEEFKELASLLALPEEDFKLLSPSFILGFEKNFNDTKVQVELAQALNATGVPLETLISEYESLIVKIDEEFKDILSKSKRDFLIKMIAITINAVSETKGLSSRIVQIPISLIHKDAKIPTYAKVGDAGLDVYALDDYEINPGETVIIPTGLKVALPLGYELQVRPRSGQSAKTKLRVANSPGTIDSGYRDEIGIIIENIEPKIVDINYKFDENGEIIMESILHGKPYIIEKGQRFAQLVLSQIPMANFYEVADVSQFGDDRLGGFGSTDENNN